MIGSFSFLQVTRTTIKAWVSSNFGGIPPLTSELAALERLKKSNNKLVSNLAPSFLIGSSSFFAGYEDNYESLDEFELRQNSTAD